MATMKTCTLNGKPIDIDEAIDLRERDRSTAHGFRCTECNQAVRPHKAGGHAAAHFEHLERNPNCSQSHVAR